MEAAAGGHHAVMIVPPVDKFDLSKVSQDHFQRLPDCLLDSILVFVCKDLRVNPNTTLKCLRCCSKALCRASDAARTSITLLLDHLKAGELHLQKLTGLTKVRFINSYNVPVVRDLAILSNAQPQLKSLSFTSDDEVSVKLQDIDSMRMLAPWCNSLQTLNLSLCSMTQASRAGRAVHQKTWAPDLPVLKYLIVRDSNLTHMDLSKCTSLQELTLSEFPKLLSCVGLSACPALHICSISLNPELANLDFKDCPCLDNLYCDCNHSLASVNLQGCSALQTLECTNNRKLTGMDVSTCTLLKTCACSHNQIMTSLNVIGCHQMKELDCRDNRSLGVMDVRGCKALKSMVVSNLNVLRDANARNRMFRA